MNNLLLASTLLAGSVATSAVTTQVVTHSDSLGGLEHVQFLCEVGSRSSVNLSYGFINDKPAKPTIYAHGAYTWVSKDGKERITLSHHEGIKWVAIGKRDTKLSCWRS